MDAAQDRLSETHRRDVETIRLGTIFGSPYGGQKAYDRWRRSHGVPVQGRGLTGMALEQAIGHLAGFVPVVNETIPAAEMAKRRMTGPTVRMERAI